jgi:hypothetical protein
MIVRLRELAIRVFSSVSRRRSGLALDQELQSHLEMATEWHLRRGLTLE